MEEIDDVYPLSPMQTGLLLQTVYAPEAGVYLDQLHYTLEADLNSSAFEQAWRYLVQRHPAFRTSFHWEELDEPLQIVHSSVEVPFQHLDWRGQSEPDRQARWESLLREDRARGVDLTQAPLMRFTLVRTADRNWQLLWTVHHLLMDRWTHQLVQAELRTVYEALCGERRIQLPPVRPFRDYIHWLKQQDPTRAERYWQKTLAGLTAPTVLPIDRAPGGAPSHQLPLPRRLLLSEQTTAALMTLARQQRLTLSTLLYGAWALVLSRYTGEQDVVFGATLSGRPATLEGVEAMVGVFINSLPVRVPVPPRQPLMPWLQQLQATLLELRDHEYSSLPQIRGWSQMAGTAPLFESLVVIQNIDVSATQP